MSKMASLKIHSLTMDDGKSNPNAKVKENKIAVQFCWHYRITSLLKYDAELINTNSNY